MSPLSENDNDLAGLYVVICMALIILGKNTFFRFIYLQMNKREIQHKDLKSQQNYLTSDGRNMPP